MYIIFNEWDWRERKNALIKKLNKIPDIEVVGDHLYFIIVQAYSWEAAGKLKHSSDLDYDQVFEREDYQGYFKDITEDLDKLREHMYIKLNPPPLSDKETGLDKFLKRSIARKLSKNKLLKRDYKTLKRLDLLEDET